MTIGYNADPYERKRQLREEYTGYRGRNVKLRTTQGDLINGIVDSIDETTMSLRLNPGNADACVSLKDIALIVSEKLKITW